MSKFPALTAPLPRIQTDVVMLSDYLGGAFWTSDTSPERSAYLTAMAHERIHKIAEAMGYDLVPKEGADG